MANTQNINIGDSWKDMVSGQINIGDSWKDIAEIQVNIGDSWKTAYVSASTWDVSTATYDSKYKSVYSETAFMFDFFFKSDGTKMYVLDVNDERVYQYTLSTAWDVSTATYDSKYKSVTTQDPRARGLFFKPDGTKMYYLGDEYDKVYQYTLSTAWDVSTASYASKYKDVSSEDSNPKAGLFFKPDGLKMYIGGQTNASVFQCTLSTAWDVSTASYASLYKDISDEDTSLIGLFFKPDGTKMYVAGSGSDPYNLIYQYSIS